MDGNKLERLQQIKYTIQPVCALCEYSNFPNNDWGTCSIYHYMHRKHNAIKRELSINKFGHCDKFKLDSKKAEKLETYKDFFE